MPFLAHAFGTLVGAILAASMAANYKMRFAMIIGICFLVAGIMNVFMLPSPVWFTIVDLVIAYVPMAYLAGKIVLRKAIKNLQQSVIFSNKPLGSQRNSNQNQQPNPIN